jgi:hypothetical protein
VASERVGVNIEGIRNLLEAESHRSGKAPLSVIARQLLEEGLKARYEERTIGELISDWEVEALVEKTQLDPGRIADFAVGEPPTNQELVQLSKGLLLSPEQLARLRDRGDKHARTG